VWRTADYPPLIVIAGATATGKTELSLRVAEQMPRAEIISADSRQVYRGMDIGTAKVSAGDRARAPHHGLDLVDPDQPFTAADYLMEADQALRGIATREGVAILVGGTGLYLRAVARGVPLDETGHDPETRAEIEQRLAEHGFETLVNELRELAPTLAARTDVANPRRIIRALERARIHGDVPPPQPRGYPARSVWIGVDLAPEIHRGAIVGRARAQFENGLLDEAAALRARYDPNSRAFSAVGYAEAFGVLDARLSVDQAVDQTIIRTNQFARRQRTWFRREPDINWFDAAGAGFSGAVAEHARHALDL
jgi:tRNA dimethylallyltransferase